MRKVKQRSDGIRFAFQKYTSGCWVDNRLVKAMPRIKEIDWKDAVVIQVRKQ